MVSLIFLSIPCPWGGTLWNGFKKSIFCCCFNRQIYYLRTLLQFQSWTLNTFGHTVLLIYLRSAMQAKNFKSYKHPPRVISPDVEKHICPIYKELSKVDLLIKCLGGHTQNANESFNSTVWRLCPKHLHSGNKIVETAAFIAAGTFNEGHAAIFLVMDMLNKTIGQQYKTRARASATASPAKRLVRLKGRPDWLRTSFSRIAMDCCMELA